VAASARALEASPVGRADERGDAMPAARPWRWGILAAAAALLLAVGTFAWLRSRPSADPLDTAFATLRERRADLFADARPLSKEELAADGATGLRGGIAWISPGGTTTDVRPTFSWAEVPGAAGYRLTVLDSKGERVLVRQTPVASLDGSTLPTPLVEGGEYVAKVEARDAPTPAEASTAFRVATAEDRARTRAALAAIDEAVAADLRDVVKAQTLVRKGLWADALPFARRAEAGGPLRDVARATREAIERRLAVGGPPR
jgi:hypothetical protein